MPLAVQQAEHAVSEDPALTVAYHAGALPAGYAGLYDPHAGCLLPEPCVAAHLDLAKIEAPDGCLKAAMEAREQKMARFIGITCHAYPDLLATALDRHEFPAPEQ